MLEASVLTAILPLVDEAVSPRPMRLWLVLGAVGFAWIFLEVGVFSKEEEE